VLVLATKKDVSCRPFYRSCDFVVPSQSNDFVDAGYEVNVNFGPVILTDGWRADYASLFSMLDDALSEKAKRHLAAEIIFLTHSKGLHEVNLKWHPKGEGIPWRPELQ
jgi:spore photoproduct lyase